MEEVLHHRALVNFRQTCRLAMLVLKVPCHVSAHIVSFDADTKSTVFCNIIELAVQPECLTVSFGFWFLCLLGSRRLIQFHAA